MSKPDDDRVKMLIHSIGLKYNLQDEVIRKIIASPYRFARETIKALDIRDDITEEEYNELKTNFNLPSIGKLYSNYEVFKKHKKIKERRWEN